MTRLYLLLAWVIITLPIITACDLGSDEEDETLGNWIRRSDFEGIPRSNAVSFTIGNYAYVGLGYDGEDDLRDFWRYDPALDFWQRVDSFPGVPRRAAVAFSIGNKGYIGTGYNRDLPVEELNDFWEFDPAAPAGQQWTRKADFMGTARYNAVGFAINNKGYIGTGYDGNWLKDFYEYDPANNKWTQIVSLGGAKREEAVAFLLNNKAYVTTGRNNGSYVYDLWEFDPATMQWTEKTNIDEDDDYAVYRSGAVAAGMNGLGYIMTGSNGTSLGSVWEYDAAADVWEEKTGLEGTVRINAVSFVINGRMFVTTGNAGGTRLDDLWEFKPMDEYNEDD
ncbi:MAG: Kelch repeat-containing protein [Saprospiraceae bacterium]